MAPTSLKQMLKDFVSYNITLDDERRKVNFDIMTKITNQLIEKMKTTDPLFKEIFNNQVYPTGSYFENLKVRDTNEFDLNIILNLPFKDGDITKIQCFMVPKGPTPNQLSKIATDSGPKLNQHLKTLVINNQSKSGQSPTKPSPSNDATDKLLVGQNVNVISYGSGDRSPDSPRPNAVQLEGLKPQDTFFRLSMPDAERQLMHGKRYLKTLIRIFKAMRDKENWNYIASYHIKTMFLWQVSKYPDAEYWDESKMDELFILMLKEFRDRVEQRLLPHIIFSDYNLFDKLTENEANGVKCRLGKIISYAEKNNLEKLIKIFPGKPADSKL